MLINQSSQDDTLVGDWPSGAFPGDAVSLKSSQDERRKRSPGKTPRMAGNQISDAPQERRERSRLRSPKTATVMVR
ncbi:MAG: hypothetical protein M3N32_04485 [Actinomycetota bacterium]|nr:hypothetical protein [Actinomycetota bacterium]